jgi:hypothetical protein
MMIPDPPATNTETPPVEPTPEPEGDTTPPTIISVSPANEATGVDIDVEIVITFSEPMDRDSAEAAYLSEELPSSGVSFAWNEESTVMTVIPNSPLTLPSGTDPEQVQARTYRYVVLNTAKDVAGNALESGTFSFSSLREIRRVFGSMQDRSLTGNYRSNDDYGNNECQRNNRDTMCVGDVNATNQLRGFMTFDAVEAPEGTRRVSMAEVAFEITGTAGQPFQRLNDLLGEHVAFQQINLQAFNAQPLMSLGVVADAGGVGSILTADVREAVQADIENQRRTQFRFRFQTAANNNMFDAIASSWDTHQLNVTFVVE